MQPAIAIACIAALLYRAWSRKSLTPAALVTAGLTASIHALHPWSIGFALLGIFFLSGTFVTKVGVHFVQSSKPSLFCVFHEANDLLLFSMSSCPRKSSCNGYLAIRHPSGTRQAKLTPRTLAQVKHNVKAQLTLASTGASGGEGARTSVQVLANSLSASALILSHLYLKSRTGQAAPQCFAQSASAEDLIVVGIISYSVSAYIRCPPV